MPTNSSTWNTKLASMNQHLTKSKPNIVSVVENAENIPHACMSAARSVHWPPAKTVKNHDTCRVDIS